MSLDIVKKQIETFLGSETPEVMAIKGTWGVGKTYTWNKLLKDAKDNNKIKLKSYAYASLFGINSLEALKYAIFEQKIDINLIGKSPSLDTFKSNADDLLASLGKKSLLYFQGAPFVKNFVPAIQSASFLSVTKTIICIDDFERKSAHVSLRDLLGLVLLLKEQRKCKIVLIFNDEKMGDENFDEYQRFREKVIDFEIEFKPTPKECIEIALPNKNSPMQKVGELVERLGISNIRIIKKIERMGNILHPILLQYEEEVLSQALHTLCLYALCFYSGDKSVPDYKYVKNIGYRLFGLDNEKQSDDEKEWNSFLREYGYQHADEFDLRIAEAVEKGYVHEERLLEEAKKLHNKQISSKSEASFSKAWRLYHDSFSDNEKEVVEGLYNSFVKNANHISRVDLNGTVKLFRELGKNDLADGIIEIYIKAHKENASVFNLEDYSFAGDITDTTIRKRFSELFNEQKVERTIKDVLAKIAGKDSWGREDEKILANASSDEFYNVFKAETGEHLDQYVDVCLRFGRIGNASDQYKNIALNATLALQKIAKESPLNERRVKKFGVQLGAEGANEQGA